MHDICFVNLPWSAKARLQKLFLQLPHLSVFSLIKRVFRDALIDKGFGADKTEAAVLFITNGGHGVDFRGYLDVKPQSKLAAKLATLDVAKTYTVFSKILTCGEIMQGLT